jgi:hypothetical protein
VLDLYNNSRHTDIFRRFVEANNLRIREFKELLGLINYALNCYSYLTVAKINEN